jgi:hypothetical protein
VVGMSTYQSGPPPDSMGCPALAAMSPCPRRTPRRPTPRPTGQPQPQLGGRGQAGGTWTPAPPPGSSTTMTPSMSKSPGMGNRKNPGENSRSSPRIGRSGAKIRVTLRAAMGTRPAGPVRSSRDRSHATRGPGPGARVRTRHGGRSARRRGATRMAQRGPARVQDRARPPPPASSRRRGMPRARTAAARRSPPRTAPPPNPSVPGPAGPPAPGRAHRPQAALRGARRTGTRTAFRRGRPRRMVPVQDRWRQLAPMVPGPRHRAAPSPSTTTRASRRFGAGSQPVPKNQEPGAWPAVGRLRAVSSRQLRGEAQPRHHAQHPVLEPRAERCSRPACTARPRSLPSSRRPWSPPRPGGPGPAHQRQRPRHAPPRVRARLRQLQHRRPPTGAAATGSSHAARSLVHARSARRASDRHSQTVRIRARGVILSP